MLLSHGRLPAARIWIALDSTGRRVVIPHGAVFSR